MFGRKVVTAGAFVILSGVMAPPAQAQNLVPVRRQAIRAFAGRSPVSSLLRYAEELGLTSRQIARLRDVEDQTGTANRKLLEQNGIRIDVRADDSASAETVYVERRLLLALRENIRLGAVRARSIMSTRQRALERELITGAAGRRQRRQPSR